MKGLTLACNVEDMSTKVMSTSLDILDESIHEKQDKHKDLRDLNEQYQPQEILDAFDSSHDAQNDQYICHELENKNNDIPSKTIGSENSAIDTNEDFVAIDHRVSTIQQFNLKSQLKTFSIKLNSHNTIHYTVNSFVLKLFFDKNSNIIKNLQAIPFKKRTIIYLYLGVLLVWIMDRTLNDLLLNSLLFQLFITSYIIFAVLTVLSCINIYVVKQITQYSLVFWYKLIYTIIAIISRMIYFDFWIDWKYNDISGKNSSGMIYFVGCCQIIAFLIALLIAIWSDGVSTLHITPNIVKFMMTVGVLLMTYFYYQLYFNLYDFNIYKSINITFGNNNNVYPFYWRSIALSSFSKIIVFLSAQIYNQFKHSSKINIIPLPVSLIAISYNQAKADANADAMTFELHKATNSNTIAIATTTAREISTGSATASAENVNVNVNANANETELEFSSFEQLKSNIQVTVIIEQTLFYSLLLFPARFGLISKTNTNIDGIETIDNNYKMKCIKYSGFLHSNVKYIFGLCSINTLLLYFFGSNIVINLFELILLTLLLLNINTKFVYFKRKSFVLYWKLYNTLTLWIVIFSLDYVTKSNKFNPNTYPLNDYNIALATTNATISTLNWVLVIFIASLGNGFIQVSNKWRLFGLFIIIAANLRRAIYHFFNPEIDYQVKFLNEQFSLRSLIVTKCFDLSLWFCVQFYQMLKYPSKMFVTSKIQLKWM